MPNYIFPVMGSAYYSNVNLYQFQSEMFRPLYWFGQGTAPSFNEKLVARVAPGVLQRWQDSHHQAQEVQLG